MRPTRRAAALVPVPAALAVLALAAGVAGPALTAAQAAPAPSTAAPATVVRSAAVTTSAAACSIFPADNIWHAKATGLPVAAHSAAYVKSIGASSHAHPDFGSGHYAGAPFGIPVTKVDGGTAKVHVTFHYKAESDKGPYLVPSSARVEGGSKATGDRHVIVYDTKGCRAYELYAAHKVDSTHWKAGSGAIFNLRSNALRPKGWTSADAAGLSILAGLVQYGQVHTGAIHHAIRMTVPRTRTSYVWPARHQAGDSASLKLPPMGQRFRLKADVDISHFPRQARIVAQALKTYGAIVADNGSSWYLSGTQDHRWSNSSLHSLGDLTGSDFEAVDSSSLMVSSSSGQAGSPG